MPLQKTKTSKLKLNWLFRAYYDDNHIIEQTPEDKCLTRNDGTGSAFTDVLSYEKGKLVGFMIFNDKTDESVYIDLTTGVFMVNGADVAAHNQEFDPTKYDLELVYFRETRVDRDSTVTVQEDRSLKESGVTMRHYVNRYFIGYKTTVNGRSKQVTLAVSGQ